MSKDSVSQWDTTAANNTDVGGVDLGENTMRPRDVNNAIRTLMAQIRSNAPAGATTDNTLPRFDGTAGALQTSTVTVTDLGYLTAARLLASATSAASYVFANEQSTGFNAEVAFQSGGVTKWEIGKDSVDNFFFYDNVGARNVITITASGDMVLMPAGGNVDSAGAIRSTGTGGVGYKTGAGGTVTQATSKATGVTLNKACGEITMNGAALAAATIVSFVMTNSSIEAGDRLVLNHVSGGTLGVYGLNAACAGGSATIYVRNNTAGSLSEAIVIGFALIKGATA